MSLTKERKRYLAIWREKNREKCREANRKYRLKKGCNPNYYYSDKEKAKIAKLYESGISLRNLGKMFNRDRGRMGEMLVRYGVTLRTHKEALSLLKKDKVKICGWKTQEWSRGVIERDKECQHCGTTDSLEAHHIKRKSEYPELILDVENGICLCTSCHKKTDSYDYNKSN